MKRTIKPLIGGLVFPESPRWHAGCLYFSDMFAQEVVALRPDGVRRTLITADAPLSGLGWLPNRDMLIVSMSDRRLMKFGAHGQLAIHADLSQFSPYWLNDMIVDPHGRAYVGNLGCEFPGGTPAATQLACVEANGCVRAVAAGLVSPNGMAIAPDGRSIVIAETFASRLTAFDIRDDGSLGERRAWAVLPNDVAPDGICMDANGGIWLASPHTREVLHVRKGGEIAERILLDQAPLACMLGGAERRDLYITSVPKIDIDECLKTRSAQIQVVEVEVPGAGGAHISMR